MKHPARTMCVLSLLIPSLLWADRSDPQEIANTLGDFFQIYLLKKERRSAEDSVDVKKLPQGGYVAEISYWRSLKSRDPSEEICKAYEWLLLGRTVYGKGAMEAFLQYPAVAQINLRLFDIEFTTKTGGRKGEILPSQRMLPYLRLGVTRASLARKNPNPLEIKAFFAKGQCSEVGRKYFDLIWFDQNYIRQGQAS